MTEVQISLKANDQLSPAFQKAMAASEELSASLQKLLKQDQVNKTMEAARGIFDGMTEAERQSALAVMEFDQAQQKAAQSSQQVKDKVSQTSTTIGGELKNALSAANDKAAALIQQFTGLSASTFTWAGGIGLLVNGLIKDVQAAANAEEINTRLNSVLKSMGGSSGMTAGELNRLATKLSDMSAVSGGAIKNAEALMLTFGNVGKETFPQAMEAALNMSSVLGQDLQTSVIQLGKALNDPNGMGALKRVGVSFTDAQVEMGKAMYESGHIAEYQKMVLEELGKEFGGAAADNARTFNGEMRQLGINLAASGKEIGQIFLPGLESAAHTLNIMLGAARQINAALGDHNTEVAQTATNYADYRAEMERSINAAGMFIKQENGVTEVFKVSGGQIVNVTDKIHVMTQAEFEATKAADDHADSSKDVANAFEDDADKAKWYAVAEKALTGGTKDVVLAMRDQAQTANLTADRMDDLTATAARQREALIKDSDAYKNLRSAEQGLADAQDNFNKSFGDKAVSSLEQAGVKGDKLAAVYAEIDAKLGTHYAAQKKNEDAMAALAKQYAAGQITAEEYAKGLEEQKPAWEELDGNMQKARQSLEAARMAWDNFMQKLGEANGFHATVYVDTIVGYGKGGGGGRPQTEDHSGGKGAKGYASGLDTVIPPGYPNDSFPLGLLGYAQSGEHVKITPANEVTGGAYSTAGPMTGAGGASVTNNVTTPIYASVRNDLDLEALAYRIAKIQQAHRGRG